MYIYYMFIYIFIYLLFTPLVTPHAVTSGIPQICMIVHVSNDVQPRTTSRKLSCTSFQGIFWEDRGVDPALQSLLCIPPTAIPSTGRVLSRSLQGPGNCLCDAVGGLLSPEPDVGNIVAWFWFPSFFWALRSFHARETHSL